MEDGEEFDIGRDNMPFGDLGNGEFGTCLIGYARSPHRIERMLQNMFIGNPPGTYHRPLDVSRAVTGSLFFVPSATVLEVSQGTRTLHSRNHLPRPINQSLARERANSARGLSPQG